MILKRIHLTAAVALSCFTGCAFIGTVAAWQAGAVLPVVLGVGLSLGMGWLSACAWLDYVREARR